MLSLIEENKKAIVIISLVILFFIIYEKIGFDYWMFGLGAVIAYISYYSLDLKEQQGEVEVHIVPEDNGEETKEEDLFYMVGDKKK